MPDRGEQPAIDPGSNPNEAMWEALLHPLEVVIVR